MASILRFISHSHRVLTIAKRYGWLPAARYTNLRDTRGVGTTSFLDIDWQNYSFSRHLSAAEQVRPLVTVARDIDSIDDLSRTLKQAQRLEAYAQWVVIVPKDPRLAPHLDEAIPRRYLLGYSVPTRYGATPIEPDQFRRPVHLLGGRPDIQRELAEEMPVVSIDGNRLTLDARFGDFFDGQTFRPHPEGGYERCITDSLRNVAALWEGYEAGWTQAHG